MPKVFEWNGYKFFFFANEGDPREPCHIHVRKGEKLAKYWVDPVVQLEWASDMTSGELNGIQGQIEEHASLIRRKWNEFFRDKSS